MPQRTLATFYVGATDDVAPSTEIRVVEYTDSANIIVGGVQVELNLKQGTIQSWTWLGIDGPTHALASAIRAAGWGALAAEQWEPVAASDYRTAGWG